MMRKKAGTRPFTVERLIGLLQRPKTWLRHDVDCSLDAAIAMARTEEALDVHARYYLMTDSPFYTPEEAFVASLELRDLGATTGWHVDLRKPHSFENLRRAIHVSAHCPRKEDLWRRIPGVQYAYDPIWRGSYYADSRGRFAYGDPEDHDPDRYIQVNLHPEWWFDPHCHDAIDDETYEAFFHEPKERLAA